MASTATTFDAFLKDNYDKEQVEWLTNKDRPYLGKVKKSLGTGRRLIIPVGISNPQGLAADLANAQTAGAQSSGGNIQGLDWTITWGDYSGTVSIGDKVMAQSRDNIGAFFEDKKMEIDRLYEAFGDTMETYMIGDAGHTLTPGGFTISSGVCTLVKPDDIVAIEKGMILNVSANNGNASTDILIASSAAGYVVATDKINGKFTVAATSGGSAATPSNWSGTMYAFRQGDFGGSGATRILLGYGAWCPTSDPSSTTFEGLDRTVDLAMLGGTRLLSADTTGAGLEQRIKRLCTRMIGRVRGPGPTDIMLNPEDWQSLADSLESRGQRPLDGKIGQFSYQRIQIATAGKMVDVWANKYVPKGRILAPNFDTIELKTLDGFPKIINGDGMQMLRAATANSYEFRIQAYPAYFHRIPGWCGYAAAP